MVNSLATHYSSEVILYNLPTVSKNFPFSDDSVCHVHPDDVENYREIHRQLCSGAKTAHCEVRYLYRSGQYATHDVRYLTIFDKSGKPVKAVGIARNVESQKNAEKRYLEQSAYRDIFQQNTIVCTRVNLTKNMIIDLETIDKFILRENSDLSVDNIFNFVAQNIPSKKEAEKYLDIFKCSSLINRFEKGDSNISYTHRFCSSRRPLTWVTTTARIMQNPFSGDVEALLYGNDVDSEVTFQKLMSGVIKTGYDFIACLDADSDIISVYTDIDRHGIKDHFRHMDKFLYTPMLKEYVESHVAQQDKGRALMEFSSESLIKHLEENSVFSGIYSVLDEQGKPNCKKLTAFYIDRDIHTVCLARVDITDMYSTK